VGIVYSVPSHSEPDPVGVFLLRSEAADNSAVSYISPAGCRDVFSVNAEKGVCALYSSLHSLCQPPPFISICMSPDFSILGAFDEVAVFQQFACVFIQYCIKHLAGEFS